jgi:exopolyphosphatase / guanosine-5'-triphosphate,3'-diphosphate pyrophosphatase
MSRRVAVVDVGSNSVRLLVSELENDGPVFVHTDKVMARIGQSLGRDGRIDDEKIGEVARIVTGFVTDARRMGARDIRAIATSATREAANGDELAERVHAASGVTLEVIDEDEEARLAFVGALASLDEPPAGEIGVVDVGGGSTEIVVGSAADGVGWSHSFRLGSGRLSDRYIKHDPPRPFELARIRETIDAVLPSAEDVPTPDHGLAVAGSATNLRRMVGPLLDGETLPRALRLLSDRPSQQIARQFQIEPARARLLPAGALIIEAAMERLGTSLWVCRGGIRQGATLDMIAARR